MMWTMEGEISFNSPKILGKCHCANGGKTGCNKNTCPEGFYGTNCSETCNCLPGADCNSTTGSCHDDEPICTPHRICNASGIGGGTRSSTCGPKDCLGNEAETRLPPEVAAAAAVVAALIVLILLVSVFVIRSKRLKARSRK